MNESCQPSNSVGLTQEIADQLWWRARQSAGVSDNPTLADMRDHHERLRLARRAFVELAIDYPHYATNKEIAFFCNVSVSTINVIRNEWLLKQRSERNNAPWVFKSIRSQS